MFEGYSLVLFVHVLAAFALVGHSLGSPLTRAVLREAESLAEVRRVVAFERRASKLNPVVALVLLASGIALGSAGWWVQEWFYVAIAGWLANGLLAGRVLKPSLGALMSAAASGEGPVPPHVDALRRSAKLAVVAQVMLANDLALLFIMMNKPSLAWSLAAFGAANLALVGTTLARRAALRLRRLETVSG
jgi:hypothetical protein